MARSPYLRPGPGWGQGRYSSIYILDRCLYETAVEKSKHIFLALNGYVLFSLGWFDLNVVRTFAARKSTVNVQCKIKTFILIPVLSRVYFLLYQVPRYEGIRGDMGDTAGCRGMQRDTA